MAVARITTLGLRATHDHMTDIASLPLSAIDEIASATGWDPWRLLLALGHRALDERLPVHP